MRDLRVVGAGPAGIYAADILTQEHPGVDLIERLPAPFGLVRYGVAPDHPRIKEIVKALQRVLRKERIRFVGNVAYGIDLPGSYGAADFVSWYDGHPDVPGTLPSTSRGCWRSRLTSSSAPRSPTTCTKR